MKYPTNIYAKALVEVLAASKGQTASDGEIANNFLALVKKNGDEGHLKKILEEASRMARGKSGVRKVTVASARSLTAAQKKSLDQFTKPGDVMEEEIDPDLIAGIKITINDEMQYDGSLKNKLNNALGTA